MVRGIQKQIIHVKNPESPWCEEAFLIVRGGAVFPDTSATMAEEVERMLSGSDIPRAQTTAPHPLRALRWGVSLLMFFGGICLGAAVTLILL